MSSDFKKYGFVRIAVVSPEMRVGDVIFNTEAIIRSFSLLKEKKCNLALYPELSLTGYTCGDLFFQKKLLESVISAINTLENETKKANLTIVVGAPISSNGRLFNSALVISNGSLKGIIPKTYLANSNEYYEKRWFSSSLDNFENEIYINNRKVPFGTDILFDFNDFSSLRLGIEICEDLWAVIPPSLYQVSAGANLIFNLSASSEYLSKADYRRELVKSQSARCLSAYAYSSSGPNESSTDLVYSGHCIIAENGYILAENERFNFNTDIIFSDIDLQKIHYDRINNNAYGFSKPNKNFRIVPLDQKFDTPKDLLRKINKTPFVPLNLNDRNIRCKEIFEIQTAALSKRLKHINTDKVVIGLSGGLDSTLALLVAVNTFKKLKYLTKNIICVGMPGFGTTKKTKDNAKLLANHLKVTYKEIDIKKSVLSHFEDIGHSSNETDIVFENAQARERTQILMDLANQEGGIVLGTGDLSEIALGWSTYNGDHMSMYGINSGVPKTLVKYIIKWCADVKYSGKISEILNDIIETPISPELLPADISGKIKQKTEEVIGPYILHDFFLYYMIRFGFEPQKIYYLAKIAFNQDFKPKEILKWLKVFYQRFFQNQFKRNCIPDGVKVGVISLSPRGDWRMPSDASVDLWLRDLDEY
ncbi:MAG: NAD(+) synthase [Candidatus Kapabacteria bacterium]|nr:NAD(+) synthase [Candidatus Kapabacteria bacterium]